MGKYILTTTVLDCKNLTYNGNPLNDSNVFIRLHIFETNSYYKTLTISNTANPVWNESINIPINDLSTDQLAVEVIMSTLEREIDLSDTILLPLNSIEEDSKETFAAEIDLTSDGQFVGTLNLNFHISKMIQKPTGPVLLKYQIETSFTDDNLYFILNLKDHDESESTVIRLSDLQVNNRFLLTLNDISKDVLLLTLKNGDTLMINKEEISLRDIEIPFKYTHTLSFEDGESYNNLTIDFEGFDLESYIRDNQIEVHIKVLKVENLTNFDANSTGSFVKVSVGDEEASTNVKKLSKSIEWNEEFDFVSTDFFSDNLVLQLYSKGMKASVNKRMIEDLSFPLIKLKNIEFCPPTVYTVPMKMRGKDVGQISFEFSSKNPNLKIPSSKTYNCEFTILEANFKNCKKEDMNALYGLTSNSDAEPKKIEINKTVIFKIDSIDDELIVVFEDLRTSDDYLCDPIVIQLKFCGINNESEIRCETVLDDKAVGFVRMSILISDNEQDKEDTKSGLTEKSEEKSENGKSGLTEKSEEKSENGKSGLSEKVVEKSDEDEDVSNCFIDDEEEKFFVIEKKIGEGATSVAYKVIDKRNDRVMCKKVLKFDTNKTFSDAQNTIKEFEVLRILRHPCICRSFRINLQEEVEFNDEVTTVALFLEYCPISLKTQLENKKLDNTMKTKIAVEIAHAMLFIHNNGMIHRDLKIENIMLAEDNTVKLIDFGLVKIYESLSVDYSFTKESMTRGVGTFNYMSPEMLSEGDYDYKTDVYSYGVVLYYLFLEELLKIPYKDKMSKKKVQLPEPSSSISSECLDIIKKCLRSTPNNRPSFKKILKKMRECSFNLADDVDQESIIKRDKMLIPFDSKKDKKTK